MFVLSTSALPEELARAYQESVAGYMLRRISSMGAICRWMARASTRWSLAASSTAKCLPGPMRLRISLWANWVCGDILMELSTRAVLPQPVTPSRAALHHDTQPTSDQHRPIRSCVR